MTGIITGQLLLLEESGHSECESIHRNDDGNTRPKEPLKKRKGNMTNATLSRNGKSGTENIAIEVPRIDVKQLEITLIGDSELISHRWSEKAKKEMLDKQMKKAKAAKEAKDPQRDYEESLYMLPGGGYGFPCVAFKAAAVGACRFADGVKMTEARGAFHVDGELAEIKGAPRMREDMVRIGQGTADLRYRGGFPEWRTTLTISYNAAALSPAQIINLFNLAGFGVGVGEWRPEKDGPYGRFHVAAENEV